MNNKTKHTPGPWTVLEKYTGTNRFPIGSPRQDGATSILAEVNGQGGVDEENTANARLIAAAPELLEALKAALSTEGDFVGWDRKARAAIAKAGGDS